MSRRVFLHVGAPKTGTTYVQDRLALNVKQLRAHGVHFPSRHPLADPALSQFRAALDLLGQDWGGPSGHAEGAWPALVRRIGRLDGTVVVSHEMLAPAKPAQVERALHDLRASEVHLVYSARDIARQVPAAWQERVKQGSTMSYGRFTRRMERGKAWFGKAFDLPQVLETWGAAIPPERVHVVTVPHTRSDLLWTRFCSVVGIDPAWAPVDSDQANRSLGIAETQVLRRLNKRLDGDVRRDAAYDRIVRERLAQDMLANRRGTRVLLPPRLHPWAVEQADRWSRWIEESGVDLVGELADLQPAPPVPEDQWPDPDRPSTRAQLGAALDALGAMTLEAARRPDPDARVSARIKDRWRS